MKKILLFFFVLVTICETTTAQNSCNRWYIDFNYIYLTPLQDFRDGGFKRGHGVSFGGYYNLTPSAQKVVFHTGVRLNGIIGKNAKNKISLADPVGATAKSRVYNGIIDLQTLARVIFQPQAKWSPYLGV